jgi:hypothetical protein
LNRLNLMASFLACLRTRLTGGLIELLWEATTTRAEEAPEQAQRTDAAIPRLRLSVPPLRRKGAQLRSPAECWKSTARHFALHGDDELRGDADVRETGRKDLRAVGSVAAGHVARHIPRGGAAMFPAALACAHGTHPRHRMH